MSRRDFAGATRLGRLAGGFGAIVALLALSGTVSAQAAGGADGSGDERTTAELAEVQLGLVPGRPRVRPTRLDTPPVIDGRLDDEAWRRAAVLADFVQESPLDGASATENTEVFVAYDDDYLYFGFYAHYENPSIMRASRVDRDRAMADDLFTVYLDPFLGQQRAFSFDVNAYGVQGDGILNAGGASARRGGTSAGTAIPRPDRSWDALFESGAQIVPDGYTAEMAIPLKSLRYPRRPEGETHRWGLQIVREIKDKDQENIVWAPMSRAEPSFYSQMGVLDGMTGLSTTRNLEVLPTFTAIQYGEINPTREPGPGFVNQDMEPDAGVNVKYGMTSNLTADFTLNPDFSQIESDRPQIEVNQRFPLFFQELRPFFVEGSEIFEIAAPVTVVHTRTIVDPDYGAKLSGKVGRLSFGVLGANDAAPGRVDDPADPSFERKAQTYIGRGKFEVSSESYIGAVVTDREFLGSHSRLAGLDGNLRLGGSTRPVSFNFMSTRHRDLDGVERRGYLTDVMVRHRGRNLEVWAQAFQISPDFETDAGFVRRRDQQQLDGRISYTFWHDSWIINQWHGLRYYRNYDFDDVLQEELLRTGLNLLFAHNISAHVTVDRTIERFAGIDFKKPRINGRANVNTSQAVAFGARFSMGDQIRFTDDPFLGDQVQWGLNATLRPISRLTSNLSFDSSRLTDPRNGDEEVFNVKIFRAQSTFQFTDRLQIRNITEYNTFDETFDLNVLFTYRVNAGTVLYVGYDDHYRQADLIWGDINGDDVDEQLFFENDLRRTNRALFAKFQYLFRF